MSISDEENYDWLRDRVIEDAFQRDWAEEEYLREQAEDEEDADGVQD